MRAWRIWVVLAVAAAIVFGHLYDIVTMTEQWPFSHYPMYARAETRKQISVLSLFAVIKRDGKRQVVRLTDAPDIPQLPALNEGRLRVILMTAWNRPAPQNVELANQVLADYIRLYETRRFAGEIDGPRILEARLYRIRWRLRPDGSRVRRPLSTELLTSVAYDDVFK